MLKNWVMLMILLFWLLLFVIWIERLRTCRDTFEVEG